MNEFFFFLTNILSLILIEKFRDNSTLLLQPRLLVYNLDGKSCFIICFDFCIILFI